MDRPTDMQPARAEPIRLTYEDYLAFPDDGRRHELIDGEHVVTPSLDARHQKVVVRLVTALNLFVERHSLGDVYVAPLDVILSDTDVVQPDVLFVASERRGIIRGSVHGFPDLAVEVVLPSSRPRDEVAKRRLFDRFGVREYWIVDPEVEVVKVYRRGNDAALTRVAELASEHDDVIETPRMPGLQIRLVELFADWPRSG